MPKKIYQLLFIMSLMVSGTVNAQKFAHVSLPEEIDYVAWSDDGPYAASFYSIWKIDTSTWTPDSVAALKSRNPFKTIQGITGCGKDLYFYVNGDGIYRLQSKGLKPLLVRPRNEKFLKHIEEAYSQMGTDPTGQYLLLYGKNENAVVFDIARSVSPIVVFNDYVIDAYWIGNTLWTGCLDKVVVNRRTGKSSNNEDFIGLEDQSGMTKFYLRELPKIPENGETRIVIDAPGDIERLIYNKKNGDLLLCVSSWNVTNIYKITHNAALPVASLDGIYGDFAAYGDKIIARTGNGFVEFSYGDNIINPDPKPIVTDIMRPKAWKGDKPRPYTISGSKLMDFDNDGNLWIAYGRDLFVRFNK